MNSSNSQYAIRLASSSDKVHLRHKLRAEFTRLTGMGHFDSLPYLPLLHDCKSVEDITTILADYPELLL